MNYNLEEEYGAFLDSLEKFLSDDSLEHFGVKGMKWGVNKAKSGGSLELSQLGPDKVVRKTASGETITMTKQTPTAIHKTLARMSKTYRKEYGTAAYLTIENGSGKKVGSAQVVKRSDDELYLLWLGVNTKERGKGYATAVMKAAEDFGKQSGFKKMTLEVPGNSPDARHIYEKLGFKFVSEEGYDPVWGGLTNMEYVFDTVKHEGGVMTDLMDAMLDEDEFLEHYGIKGMQWGKRKAETTSTHVSADAARVRKIETRLKKNGPANLSNDDIAKLNKRNQLMGEYKKNNPSKLKKGYKATKEAVAVVGTITAAVAIGVKVVKSPLAQKGAAAITEALKNLG